MNEVTAQDIRREQHLARASLERLGAQLLGSDPDAARREPVDELLADKYVVRSNPDFQTGDGWIWTLDQLDDEILQTADFGPRWVQHRAPQQLRHRDAPLVVAFFQFRISVVTHRLPSALAPLWSRLASNRPLERGFHSFACLGKQPDQQPERSDVFRPPPAEQHAQSQAGEPDGGKGSASDA